ncbi:MAG: sortase A [Ilumatobacter sp.]|jgi:sortase A
MPGPDGIARIGRTTGTAPKLTRRGRVPKFDRPPPPHDWRWYIGNLGKTLITVGLLMFTFVGYQLYGTGIETAAQQNRLENEFEELLKAVDPISASDFESNGQSTDELDAGSSDTAAPDEAQPDSNVEVSDVAAVPVADQNIPDLEDGDALARIEIPKIGVNDIIVAGVQTGDLKKGPGHFPDTPLPGQLGNAAIAGHRTTYGQPFRNVDQLDPGDEIRVTTLSGVFVYKVTGTQIVSPSDYQVVATTDPTRANLTLTSCHPVFTARERIVIFSELDRTESAPVGEPVINYGRPEEAMQETAEIPGDADLLSEDLGVTNEPGTDDPTTPAVESSGDTTGTLVAPDIQSDASQLGSVGVNEGIADAFSEGWFSDPSANTQVGLWGLILSVVSVAAYAISRRLRRDWGGLLIGLVPFTLALYFFFQNVNRLLPPNL